MKVEPKSYGMFTSAGDRAVGMLVDMAKAKGWDWPQTYRNLRLMTDSNPELYGEATDTVVREYVYDALGYDTPFYI
jgi:hypothetical protein